MLLKDRATVFMRQEPEADPYGVAFRRFDLRGVMVFEKQAVSLDRAVGGDRGDGGRCVVYFFPARSEIVGKRRGDPADGFPKVSPGDLLVVGACRDRFDPCADADGICRRIVSVEKRTCGSERVHHIVIEAI